MSAPDHEFAALVAEHATRGQRGGDRRADLSCRPVAMGDLGEYIVRRIRINGDDECL
jgi:hypothetical protein